MTDEEFETWEALRYAAWCARAEVLRRAGRYAEVRSRAVTGEDLAQVEQSLDVALDAWRAAACARDKALRPKFLGPREVAVGTVKQIAKRLKDRGLDLVAESLLVEWGVVVRPAA